MPQIQLSRDIQAPPARVWEVLTNLGGAADVISGIESLEILKGGDPFDVGTRWRETRTMFGRQATEEMEVTSLDPGRAYTVVADSHGTRYESEFSIAAGDANSSRVTLMFDAEGKSTLSKLMANTIGRLFMGPTKKALAKDLDDIAAAAERDAG